MNALIIKIIEFKNKPDLGQMLCATYNFFLFVALWCRQGDSGTLLPSTVLGWLRHH